MANKHRKIWKVVSYFYIFKINTSKPSKNIKKKITICFFRWLLWSQFLSTRKLTTSLISIQISMSRGYINVNKPSTSFGKDSNPVNKPRQVLEICFFISHPSTNSLPRINLRIKCEQLCPKKSETVWDWSLEESVLAPRINR